MILRTTGFCLFDSVSGAVMTDSRGRPVLFTDYQKYIKYMKRNRIRHWDYRARKKCTRFTRNYLVI